MTVSLWLFGVQVMCFTIGAAEAEADGAELAGGTTASTPMGLVAAFELPDDASGLNRNNGWGDEGNRL